jgi:presenilin-like A22 family membrane protease
MKHSLQVTLLILALFVMTQLVGLVTVSKHIQLETNELGEVVILHPETALGEPMELEEEQKSMSFIYIVAGVIIGTLLLLLFIKFNVKSVWKYWFLLAVIMTLAVSFGVYVDFDIAFIAAVLLGWWKIFRPNPYIHNLTEIFVYTGITLIFLPILNLQSVVILLLLISLYDMYAVWKSKHMIKLAKFQTQSQVFAGLFIPYGKYKDSAFSKVKSVKSTARKTGKNIKRKGKMVTRQVKNAVLGGGDIAFPLLFSATVMEYLLKSAGFSMALALGLTTIITFTTATALFLLLYLAEEDKFYPAMPFVSAGCFLGLGIIWLGWLM